jgi:hypothetical protein
MAWSEQNEYLGRLATQHRVTVDELLMPLREWTCGRCDLSYVDPFFSAVLEREIYSLSPIHRLGWRSAYRAVNGRPLPSWLQAAWSETSTRLGGIDSVVEIGCPLFSFAVSRPSPRGLLWSVWRSVRGLIRRRATLPPDAISAARMLAMSVGGLARRLRSVEPSPMRGLPTPPTELRRTVTGVGWSRECDQLGVQCDAFARRLCGPRHLGDVRDVARPIDLVTFVNTLDHVADPLAEIRAVQPFRAALVVGHEARGAALQHRFAFTPSALVWLANAVNCDFADLSARVGAPRGEFAALLWSRDGSLAVRDHDAFADAGTSS